jgi:hypothetical protein
VYHKVAGKIVPVAAAGTPVYLQGRLHGVTFLRSDTALLCTALHCTALHYTALHCTALLCIALHYFALHHIIMHLPNDYDDF